MNTAVSASADAARALRHPGLRILLAVVALLEAINALPSVSVLFTGDAPGSGIGGTIVRAHLAVHPVLALAALLFAIIGRVRDAIIVLGAVVLTTWLNLMPSVLRHGLEFNSGYVHSRPRRRSSPSR